MRLPGGVNIFDAIRLFRISSQISIFLILLNAVFVIRGMLYAPEVYAL
jgi:hypothetical protein